IITPYRDIIANPNGLITLPWQKYFQDLQSTLSSINNYSTIQTDLGTHPVASGLNQTLTFTSSDGSIEIDGDATTGTVDLRAVGGGGGSPDDASYLTLGLNGSLTNERVLTPGTGLNASDGGANSTYTLSVDLGDFDTDDLS